jgi:hypothetical protein
MKTTHCGMMALAAMRRRHQYRDGAERQPETHRRCRQRIGHDDDDKRRLQRRSQAAVTAQQARQQQQAQHQQRAQRRQ